MEPKLYVKKPIPVEAMQYDGTEDCAVSIERWAGPKNVIVGLGAARGLIRVATGNEVVTARRGDWILRDVEGRYYPCSNEVFAKTYLPWTGADS